MSESRGKEQMREGLFKKISTSAHRFMERLALLVG